MCAGEEEQIICGLESAAAVCPSHSLSLALMGNEKWGRDVKGRGNGKPRTLRGRQGKVCFPSSGGRCRGRTNQPERVHCVISHHSSLSPASHLLLTLSLLGRPLPPVADRPGEVKGRTAALNLPPSCNNQARDLRVEGRPRTAKKEKKKRETQPAKVHAGVTSITNQRLQQFSC